MKKFIILLLTLCCILAACSTQNNSDDVAVPTVTETEAPTAAPTEIPTEAPTEAPTEVPVAKVVHPLPATLDINALDNCTVAVSLEEGCAWLSNGVTGNQPLNVTVYTFDLYDMVDIALLEGGDVIVIRGEEVTIEALERKADGTVCINGGLDMDGYELRTDDSTVFYESGYSDVKSWQELGLYTGEAAADFVFTDSSDMEKGPITYTFAELVELVKQPISGFGPQGTTITIVDGQIVSMNRVYTP